MSPGTLSDRLILTKAVINTAAYLGLCESKLAAILGVSQDMVSQLSSGTTQLSPGTKEWEISVLLFRLFRSLDSIVGGSVDDAQVWFNAKNAAMGGKTPAELVHSVEGIERVVCYLEAW